MDTEASGDDRDDARTQGRRDRDRIRLDLSRGEERRDGDDGPAPESNDEPVEAGDPKLENVVFVVLGVISMVLVLVRMVAIPL